jgi:hypothetical protein
VTANSVKDLAVNYQWSLVGSLIVGLGSLVFGLVFGLGSGSLILGLGLCVLQAGGAFQRPKTQDQIPLTTDL